MSGQDILNNSGMTACGAKAGLAEGTNANTIKIVAPNGAGIDFSIDGIAYHKADTDNIAVTAHAAQADLTSCLYLVQIDSDGTISTKKGTERTTTTLGDNLSLEWPNPDADRCPIGGYKVAVSGGTFTNGTTDLGDGTVTDTYYDFMFGMPIAPQVA